VKKILCFSFVLLLFGCTPDEDNFGPRAKNQVQNKVIGEKSLIVLNEGNYTWNNASVFVYNPETQEIQKNVFQQTNNRPVGDVLQSMTQVGDTGILVVNNSGKLELVELPSFKSIASISGFVSPRYAHVVDNSHVLVTDLYSKTIQWVSLKEQKILQTIACNDWTESITGNNSIALVHSYNQKKLLPFRFSTMQLESPLAIDSVLAQYQVDDKVFVFTPRALFKVDLNAFQTPQKLTEWTTSLSIKKVAVDLKNQKAYILANDLFELDFSAQPAQLKTLIEADERIFYGLAFDAQSGELYLSDARDYVQNGYVYRYTQSGELVHRFELGVIPQALYFYEQRKP
jgi:hypothetical protein